MGFSTKFFFKINNFIVANNLDDVLRASKPTDENFVFFIFSDGVF